MERGGLRVYVILCGFKVIFKTIKLRDFTRMNLPEFHGLKVYVHLQKFMDEIPLLLKEFSEIALFLFLIESVMLIL